MIPGSNRPDRLPEDARFHGETEHHVGSHGAARPYSLAWISDVLIEDTLRVWSQHYRRRLSQEEAVDILMNVKRLAETLLAAAGEGDEA